MTNQIIERAVAEYIDGQYQGLTEFAQSIWDAATASNALGLERVDTMLRKEKHRGYAQGYSAGIRKQSF